MIVETEASIYLLDLKAMQLERYPREAPVVVVDSPHTLPAAVEALRKDKQPIPFEFLAPLEVGKPAVFMLQIRDDGVPTVRTTTDVINIHITEN